MNSLLTRRDALRAFALAAGAFSLPGLVRAEEKKQPAPGGPPQLKPEALGERLWLIANAGGNVAVLTGEEGPVIVDCGVPAMALPLLGEVRKLSANAGATLINTHWHYDHSGGNEAFGRAGARLVAHTNCRKRLSTDQLIEFFEHKQPALARPGLPATTVSSETTLHQNDEEIRLTAIAAPAHTDGDLLVYFAKANVLHMGDLFFHGFYPFIDYSSGGWIGGMVPAVEQALRLCDEKTKVIPGHGPVAGKKELKAYADFLATAHERLAKLQKEGRKLEEVVAALPLKDFDEKLGKGFLSPDKFVRCAYTGLLRRG